MAIIKMTINLQGLRRLLTCSLDVYSINISFTYFGILKHLLIASADHLSLLFLGSYPSPKAGATLVMHKDLLVLFGGWTRPSPYPLHQPERFFDEIHTYSPSKNWWVIGFQSNRLYFCKISFWAVVMFLFFFFFPYPRWNCIVTTHGPPPMAGHSSSVIGNTMVVFGGSLGARQMYEH